MAWRHDIQTLNSYARLIWVCTHSPKKTALSNAHAHGENTTFRSCCIVLVQNMMTVIAEHSCQRLTTGMGRTLQLSTCAATSGGYTATCLNEYPACLAFSATAERKAATWHPTPSGLCQAAALSFGAINVTAGPVGAGSPANTFKAGARHRGVCFAGEPAPTMAVQGRYQARVSRT